MGPALRGAAVIQGGQRRPPLQSRTGTVRNGTAGTPSPTHSVIARSEATRQSVLPSPKRRIPAPVTRSLARNDSAARWERRDTWVPPYGVRRSSRTGRGVRPYKAEQEPREAGRRGRRALRNHKGCAQWAGRVVRPYKAKQEPRKTGRRGRRPLRNHKGCVQWAGGGVRPYNGTAGTACPTNRRGAARTAKFRNFFFPLSASAGLRRLYSDDTGRPPVL